MTDMNPTLIWKEMRDENAHTHNYVSAIFFFLFNTFSIFSFSSEALDLTILL